MFDADLNNLYFQFTIDAIRTSSNNRYCPTPWHNLWIDMNWNW